MTRIDLDVSRYLRLARLSLPPERVESLRDELGRILERFAELRHVEAAPSARDDAGRGDAPRPLSKMRDDLVVARDPTNPLLDRTRRDPGGALAVPRVIE